MDAGYFERIEQGVLVESVVTAVDEIVETLAEISELPGYNPAEVAILNPILRAWDHQMCSVLAELERLRERMAAPYPIEMAAEKVEFDAAF
jgi:hypothetical protein